MAELFLTTTAEVSISLARFFLSNNKKEIEKLKKVAEDLSNARERVQNSIVMARRQGGDDHEIEKDVEKWLISVNEFFDKTEPIIDFYEDKTKLLCFNFFPNLMARYLLSKKTEKTTKGGVDLLGRGKFNRVTYIPIASQRRSSISVESFGPIFTYEELSQATNGFSIDNVLGEGGFGCVYKGVMIDGREVAVKQLKIGNGQGEREFRAEVEIIRRVHHRCLVTLVGYCTSELQRLLVYDYVPNNTLYHHLRGEEGKPVMNWAIRLKVAAGAARGIAYLHEDCRPRIIHRDIKSENILLDNSFEPQVADFGLARLAPELDSKTHVTTRVMGTFGYLAPEYARSGQLTEKSDVYSFGVVLLELITGRKPRSGEENLVQWSQPLLAEALENENFEALVDPKLEKNYVDSEMFRMIEVAAACVRRSAARRPRMSQVVRALDSLDELSDLTNGMKPGQSEIVDSAEHSAQIRMFRRMAFGSENYKSDFESHTRRSNGVDGDEIMEVHDGSENGYKISSILE